MVVPDSGFMGLQEDAAMQISANFLHCTELLEEASRGTLDGPALLEACQVGATCPYSRMGVGVMVIFESGHSGSAVPSSRVPPKLYSTVNGALWSQWLRVTHGPKLRSRTWEGAAGVALVESRELWEGKAPVTRLSRCGKGRHSYGVKPMQKSGQGGLWY